MPTALITGITGQDGSYLAELLLGKGYTVHGIVRRSSSFNTGRIDHILDRLTLHYGDVCDGSSVRHILQRARPDEIYHLAAQSHVRVSFDQPEYTGDTTAQGALRILEAIRDYRDASGVDVRLYQAGSSEMFGASPPPQREGTPFYPRSPYGVSKVAAHWYAVNYREAYGLFICNGILFNHESPRRGETFVTRKITRAVGRIKHGLQQRLTLGNLSACRDWGFAGDYVRAMWMMLQQQQPGDYVVATGLSHSVREFCELAFGRVHLDYRDHVDIDGRYYRPTEVDALCGDSSRARNALGWEPAVSFDGLVEMMVDADMELARLERVIAME